MASLYLHIPFCKCRCAYCGFFSTTLSPAVRRKYVAALVREMEARRDYLGGRELASVYLGGGTPSLLSRGELESIFTGIENNFTLAHEAEITLETNPDDVSESFLDALSGLPVNRISLGVQTFSDPLLHLLHRRHTGKEAETAVRRLAGRGYENLSIDLIYGLPGQSMEKWRNDVARAFSLPIRHLSCYALSYEEGTPLALMRQRGEVREESEEMSREKYMFLLDQAEHDGWERYELSSLSRPGFRSRHNSAYWSGEPYLGVGAGAHSFSGGERRWNLCDVTRYCAAQGEPPWKGETLTPATRYNERVMLGLRTKEGVALQSLRRDFGEERLHYLLAAARTSIRAGHLEIVSGREGERMRLTREGLFVSDSVMSDLFLLEE